MISLNKIYMLQSKNWIPLMIGKKWWHRKVRNLEVKLIKFQWHSRINYQSSVIWSISFIIKTPNSQKYSLVLPICQSQVSKITKQIHQKLKSKIRNNIFSVIISALRSKLNPLCQIECQGKLWTFNNLHSLFMSCLRAARWR
jgi:hypothetical protein